MTVRPSGGTGGTSARRGSPAARRSSAPQSPPHRPNQLSPTPASEVADCAEEVRRLGVALGARVDDVAERTAARSRESGPELDPSIRESFAQIGKASTAAVAHWMAGGNPEDGRE